MSLQSTLDITDLLLLDTLLYQILRGKARLPLACYTGFQAYNGPDEIVKNINPCSIQIHFCYIGC
jgi:hypothetical protein